MFGEAIRKLLAYVQLVLLISIVSSGMLFLHKHTTSSGQIVVHMHPYDLSTDPDTTKHHHSDNEIHFLDVVFHGSYLQTDFVLLDGPTLTNPIITDSEHLETRISNECNHNIFLRGPPVIA